MPSTADLVAAAFAADGDVPPVVRAVFPDPTPAAIGAAIDAFCEQALGAPVASAELFAGSVGSVHGVRRRVIVKVHPPRASVAYLAAIQTVQHRLAAAGFPARAPLVALARPLAALPGLRESIMAVAPGALWPIPHDDRFDFAATERGAEWIDAIASAAGRLGDAERAGDEVVGHTDWRAEHLRFDEGRLSAVHDWDSLAVLREPAVAGSAAHMFTATWAAPDGAGAYLPTRDEALAFVSDYEAAREGGPFTAAERRTARAALIHAMAYTARCEHSDERTDMGRRGAAPGSDGSGPARVPAGGARAFLAAHAAELLGTDVTPVPEVVPSS